jgi:hypothetical protein
VTAPFSRRRHAYYRAIITTAPSPHKRNVSDFPFSPKAAMAYLHKMSGVTTKLQKQAEQLLKDLDKEVCIYILDATLDAKSSTFVARDSPVPGPPTGLLVDMEIGRRNSSLYRFRVDPDGFAYRFHLKQGFRGALST